MVDRIELMDSNFEGIPDAHDVPVYFFSNDWTIGGAIVKGLAFHATEHIYHILPPFKVQREYVTGHESPL